MATAAAATAARRDVKEYTFSWEGTRPRGQDPQGRHARQRRGRGAVHAAPPGHHRPQGQAAARRPGRQDHREGHHAVHAPARDHDEGRRAAAAGLRHRRQGPHQPGGGQAADRHQDRSRDRQRAATGVPQVPAVLRRAVLQPGGRRRGRPVFSTACSTAWRPTRKRSSPSRARSSRRCSTRSRSSWSRSSSPR